MVRLRHYLGLTTIVFALGMAGCNSHATWDDDTPLCQTIHARRCIDSAGVRVMTDTYRGP